ncbi:hypothetical protein Brms1b_004134 [Colletotrichum noveboracense]|nr:hypothetical protein CBS470a_002433 [Colletotrichum nupharicola]KAJ0318882.1 hypothetical protein Brms1b_004134 [Colletotrichum noveboracense]
MAALLSTSALRRRLQKAFGGESAGRRLRSWGGQAEAPEKQTKVSALLRWEELPEWQHFHTFMSHSEPYYLAGIKADFHGVLALMWSSTTPLAHYTFPCSPRTRDAYVLLTGTLAALCAAATTRPNLGAVHLGHHRAALFATFGAAAFVLPIGHGALVFGAGVEWARVGGPWILATAGCNALAVLVYWAKVRIRFLHLTK